MIKANQCIFINGCVLNYHSTTLFMLFELRSGSYKLGSQRESKYSHWRFNKNYKYFKL